MLPLPGGGWTGAASQPKVTIVSSPVIPVSEVTPANLIGAKFVTCVRVHKHPSERQLTEHLQVSRPLVREALGERGIDNVQVRRGLFSRRVLPRDADGVFGNLPRRRVLTPRQPAEACLLLQGRRSRMAVSGQRRALA